MWQTITMAILHVIRQNITETALWSECVKAKSTVPHGDSFLILNIFERHWSYSDRLRRVRLEVKDFSLLRLWKKCFNSNNKWKVKNKRHVRKLFRRSIHLQMCFVLRTQRRHWRKKPLYLRRGGSGGVVLSVCDCRRFRITLCSRCRSSEGLHWGLSSPPPEFSLRLSLALCFCHLRWFFHWGKKRREDHQQCLSVLCLAASSLYTVSKDRLTQKWKFCHDLFTLMFY